MRPFFTFVAGFFREGAKESSTRLLMLSTCWTILGVWVYANFMAIKLAIELAQQGKDVQIAVVPISETSLMLFFAASGLKMGQKWLESKNGNGNGKHETVTTAADSPPVVKS